MKDDRFDRDGLLRLVDRLTNGTIDADEYSRLEEILRTRPEARQLYFAYLDLDLGLRDLALSRLRDIPPPVGLPFEPPEDRRGVSPIFRGSFFACAIAAAMALAVSLLLLVAWPGSEPITRLPEPGPDVVLSASPPVVEDVATLLFADECRWKAAGIGPVEGQRLPAGELHLLEGLALVRFDGGAVAVVSGEVRLVLESRGSVRLHRGRLTVRAPDEAVGFTVRTPASDVVDLGTEFAVEVAPNGATELHVLDGAVEYRKPDDHPGAGQLLRGGHAVRFDEASEAKPRPVAVKAKRIEELLREAKPKPREDLLVVYEGFQYGIGRLPLASADGGWGWNGPWRLRGPSELGGRDSDTTTDMQIAFQKLNVPWPIRGGRAGMLELPPGGNFRLRPLAEPLDLGADAVYYISLMMREEPSAEATPASERRGSARLTFRSSQDYWGDRVCFGLPADHKPHIELADFIRFSGSPLPEGQSLLWVAKIAARRDGEDDIFFRVYQEGESLDIVEPADWSIATRGVRSDARLDLLMLSSTGKTRRWFDELRIGTSWRAVVPIAEPTKIEAAGEDLAPSK